MKKGKVLINASMLSTTPTGVGVYGQQVVSRLIKEFEKSGISYICYSYEIKHEKNFHRVKLPFLLNFFLNRFISVHRIIWNIFYLPWIARRFDLVYSFSSHGSPFLSKQIITVHDLISLNYPFQHKFQYFYFKYIVPVILKKCKKIIAISNFTKQEILKYYPSINKDKITVIYNGSDHLSKKVTYTDYDVEQLNYYTKGKPFFLAVGASYSHKNIEIILHAAAVYSKSHTFLILGRNTTYFAHLKIINERLALSNVVFIDYVEPGFLKLLYKKAIANLCVSKYEGFGFTPIEASYFNCVSIVSKTSSLPEIYNNSVIYIKPEVADVIEKINYVISPGFKKELFLKEFEPLYILYNWEVCCANIFLIINNLMNEN